jgi:hypothetical protein
MEEEPRVLTDSELLEILIAAAGDAQAHQAIAMLEQLVVERGSSLSGDQLRRLARVDSFSDVAVNTSSLRAAVREEMERRGIWRTFRRRERLDVWLKGVRWTAGILLMAAGILAAFFGLIILLKWVLYWMGF